MEARALLTLGYVHEIGTKTHYLFHDAGWAEILTGFDLRYAADVLLACGLMLPGDGGRRRRKMRIGSTSRRFYTVSAEILEWDGRAPEPEATEAAAAALPQPDAGLAPFDGAEIEGWDDLPAW